MQWLAELCVRRPVFAWVLVLSLIVVGLFAFGQLGVDRFPNVDIPSVSVTTRLPGAAPEQIETEVTDKIEEAVNTISGIDSSPRPRPRASRRSSSPSSSRRTPTSRRRKCATASTA